MVTLAKLIGPFFRDGERDGVRDGERDGVRDGERDGARDGERDGVRDGEYLRRANCTRGATCPAALA